MSLLRHAIRLSAGGAFRRFEEALKDPEAAQRETLRRLLAGAAATAFGREHGFEAIAGPADYARQVPIRDYEGFRPYVQRMVAGEAGVLTAEAPEMYTTTSGTTGEPKLLPVTPSWRRQMTGLLRLWMVGVLRDHPTCFDGRVLTVVSPAVEGVTASGVPYGAMTGLTQQRAPWLIRRQYATPYEVALIRDYEARYFTLMRLAIAQRVTAIVTPNPSTLMRLAEVARRHGEAILRALHDGTLGLPFPETLAQPGLAPDVVEARLRERLRPDPARARALGRLMEREGMLLPRMAWPDLQLIGCWLGGSAGLQARHLAEAYGDRVALRDVGLLASEGRMTVPLADGGPEGPLYVHANYYEFIPEGAIDEAAPPVLGAHELDEGARYYLVITGGNGLYRYDMNDIVEVRGFHHRTPRVAFLRKGRDMVSITGEKLHLNQLQAALKEAEVAAAPVWQFRVIPDVEASTYDVLVEFKGEPPAPARLEAFQRAFDAALARLNGEYAGKRASGRLALPRLCVMAAGWSERLSAREVAGGKRDAQFKWQPIRPAWDAPSVDEVVLRLGSDGRIMPTGAARA